MTRLLAYYDLRCAPLSFDFAGYLACLSCYAAANGFDRIALCVIASHYRKTNAIERGYGPGYEDRKVRNVLLTLAALVPAIDDVMVVKSGAIPTWTATFPEGYDPQTAGISSLTLLPCTPAQITAAGGNPRIFKATARGKIWAYSKCFTRPLITLSLRNTPHNPVRNCDLAQWFELYERLRDSPYTFAVIPDQDDLLGDYAAGKYQWPLYPEAAMDLELRMALYDQAALNVAWVGGTQSLLVYSSMPYVIFGMWNERSGVSTKEFFARKGPAFGEQLPWSVPQQHIDWTHAPDLKAEAMAAAVRAKLLQAAA